MSPVWVNGKILDTSQPKAKEWSPAPPKGKILWKLCPDCGAVICEMESCWAMTNKTVCVSNGCWKQYYAEGLGFHAPAGWEPKLALEG